MLAQAMAMQGASGLVGAASLSGFHGGDSSRGLKFAAPPSGPFGLQGLLKRTIDLAGSFFLLLFAFPLFLLIGLLIKLDSPGPAIIHQVRTGRNGKPFALLKFRSMVRNAEQLRPQLGDFNDVQPPLFKIRQDPRITRVGRHLRRLSLDELPQLINVLAGEMSLVGPRPCFDNEVAHDLVRQSLRLKFPPGMTGLWQVCGRSSLDYDGMIRLDLHYTREWSLWLDLQILCRTMPVVIMGKGAC
ncbi:MAG: sugar transferase [Candidatus Dormibacteraeota bacterium]|nr:sugar transferase [Candidatus Dormibacteraeota bacterium]